MTRSWDIANYTLTPEGTLVHKRWLNEDGTRKTGIDLEKEQMKVELEIMAQRLIALGNEI